MSETYCGKTCTNCTYAEQLSCPSCNCGQYSPVSAQCVIATCCRSKGHKGCETCGFRPTCITLTQKDRVPDQILAQQAVLVEQAEMRAEARRKALQSAEFLGKWLWLLFWLVIPGELGGLLSNESVTGGQSVLYAIGMVLTILTSLAYGWLLLKLQSESDRYRIAGICNLIAAAVSLLVAILFGDNAPGWTLLITLPSGIVGLVGEYHEYMGHADVLEGVSNELSEQWRKLWKHYMYTFAALFGSIVLLLIAPVLGLIVFLAGAIALVVMSIRKLMYLYRTAKFFRELANSGQEEAAL